VTVNFLFVFLIIALLVAIVLSLIIYLRTPRKSLLIVFLFTILAIPVPISLSTIPFTLISLGTKDVWLEIIRPENTKELIDSILTLLTFFAMILAGTYIVTYLCTLIVTIKHKKYSRLIFLPVIHILFVIIFLLVI
jgi:hypothetical protein